MFFSWCFHCLYFIGFDWCHLWLWWDRPFCWWYWGCEWLLELLDILLKMGLLQCVVTLAYNYNSDLVVCLFKWKYSWKELFLRKVTYFIKTLEEVVSVHWERFLLRSKHQLLSLLIALSKTTFTRIVRLHDQVLALDSNDLLSSTFVNPFFTRSPLFSSSDVSSENLVVGLLIIL